MIGKLPNTLKINGKIFSIRTDYRDCLIVLQAFSDAELSDVDKTRVLIEVMYINYHDLDENDIEMACEKAIWFLNCGNKVSKPLTNKPLYDWEQDEQIIFSAINKVANKEIREVDYMHFWTFCGLFNEIGEGVFSNIVNIRQKKIKGKKLEKYEQEFYRNNKEMIDLRKKYTDSDVATLSELDKLLKGEQNG